MSKKKYGLYLSLILLITLGLLTACLGQGDSQQKLKTLEKENQELRSKLDSLQAELNRLQETLPQSQETSAASPTTTDAQVTAPQATNDEFVYEGDLVVDGKQAKDLSRSELEAMPTLVQELTNPETGEITRIYPPKEIKNLYEQLRYQAYMAEQISHNTPGKESSRVIQNPEVKAYQSKGKGLLVQKEGPDFKQKVYVISEEEDQALRSLWEQNLKDNEQLTGKVPGGLESDTQILTSDGRGLSFLAQDLKQNQAAIIVRGLEGVYYALQPQSELSLLLRDLITGQAGELIFDSDQDLSYQEALEEPLPLRFNFSLDEDHLEGNLGIHNLSEETWYYTGSYSLLTYTENGWNNLEAKQVGDRFELKLRSILPQEERSFKLKIGESYGQLTPGFYQLTFSLADESQSEEANPQSNFARCFFLIPLQE